MGHRFLFEIGRWVVRVGMGLTLAVSLVGMPGGTTQVAAANPTACVLNVESFLPPRVGSDVFQIHDVIAFETGEVWVTGRWGADYVTAKDFVLEWDGTQWIDRQPQLSQAQDAIGQREASGEFRGFAHNMLGGTSSNDVWFVSQYGERKHWDGAAWSDVPGEAYGEYSSLYVRTDADVWLTAYDAAHPRQTQFAHWNGKKLKTVKGPLFPDEVQLYQVYAIAKKDAWAVGTRFNGAARRAVVLHWDGKHWNESETPARGDSQLFGLAVVDKNDVWAVGYKELNGVKRPLTLHWNGKAWKRVAVPNIEPSDKNVVLTSVTVLGTDEVWAVGDAAGQSLALHWDGETWSKTDARPTQGGTEKVVAAGASQLWAANGSELMVGDGEKWESGNLPWFGYFTGALRRLYVVSADDAWAVNDGLVHWDGAEWKLVMLLNAPQTFLAVDGDASNELGVLGYSFADGTNTYAVMFWNGADWTRLPDVYSGADRIFLQDIAVVAADDIWVGGMELLDESRMRLAWHWNGTAWSEAALPESSGDAGTYLERFYARASDDVWATGSEILHWDGSVWSVASELDAGVMGFVSPTDIWASSPDGFLHYDGSAWTPVAAAYSPYNTTQRNGFVIYDADDIYALGRADHPFGSYGAQIQHWDGAVWTMLDNPALAEPTDDVGMISEDAFWTVGTVTPYRQSTNAFLRRYTRVCE